MHWSAGAELEGYTLTQQLSDARWLARDLTGASYVLTRDTPPTPWRSPHPSLIATEALGAHAVRPWIEGEPARPSSEEDFVRLARRISEALASLHRQGYAHGRLKPANVIVRSSGLPVLLDADPAATDIAGDYAALADLLLALGAEVELSDALLALIRRDLAPAELLEALEAGVPRAVSAADEGFRVAVDDVSQPSPPPQRAHRLWVWVAAALVLGILSWLVLSLEAPPKTSPSVPVVEAPGPADPAPLPAEPPGPAQLEALLAARERAEAVLDEYINLRLDLEERAADQWAGERFAAAADLAQQGDAAFEALEYELALARYGEALDQLQAVGAEGEAQLEQALASGRAALEAGQSAAARSAYEHAALIRPDDPAVQAGLRRAATLDEALDLKKAAQQAEAAREWSAAADYYRQLAALDPELMDTSAALARVESQARAARYRKAMSEGLAALDAEQFGQAQSSFERALALRPGDPAARDALAEAQRSARDFTQAAHQRKAQAAEQAEQWALAEGHYRAALDKDPNLEFARRGLARARSLGALYEAMEARIDTPSVWWSDQGRRETARLLEQARSVPEPGPVLRVRIAALASLLDQSRQPVAVELVSDNACRVRVYHVADLGRFDRTRLELMPGRYTAVAQRDGYRDVRREFLVPAGDSPEPVVLECKEPV